MILPSLIRYYDRLAASSSEDEPHKNVPPFGWSRQQISFCININADGTHGTPLIESCLIPGERNSRGGLGNPRPRLMTVPGVGGRTVKICPYFLWDTGAYLLGHVPEGKTLSRVSKCFESFRNLHASKQDEIDDDSFLAVCKFLAAWDPSRFKPSPEDASLLERFGVFRVGSKRGYVHEQGAVITWWNTTGAVADYITADDDDDDVIAKPPVGLSLIDGNEVHLAPLHKPAVKDVRNASPNAKLVSFNKKAFTSYGKVQSINAPMGMVDAFKYCTALNCLLDDRSRRTNIGDATVVWWTDKPNVVGETPADALFRASLVEMESPATEDAIINERVKSAMSRIARGLIPEDLAYSRTPFHVLGLSPNKARLSVRFWWDGTLGEMMHRLARHHAALALGEWHQPRHLSIQRIVSETARLKQGKRDAASVSPRLVGDVARSVIFGLPYPDALQDALLRRIRQDGKITSEQASALKAILIRKGIPVDLHLDTDYPSQAYQCGRLFAVLDHAQRVASPNIKATIASRYIRSVMSSPGALLGHLQGLAQAHIRKLDSKDEQLFFHDEIKSISARIKPPPPSHLLGTDQSVFMLGYYKQLAWLDTMIAPGKNLNRRYRTDRGEWVLSLPQKVVMNTLNKCNIKYVYEVKRLIGDAVPRVPDLLVIGPDRKHDVYIEVAGGWKDMEAYNSRHEKKIAEYAKSGITIDGGDNGCLCVLDFRDTDSRNKGWYDEKTMVIDPLCKIIPALSMQTNAQEN